MLCESAPEPEREVFHAIQGFPPVRAAKSTGAGLFLGAILALLMFAGTGCGGCSDEVRFVRMVSDTALYREASKESDRLGTIPAGQLAELISKGAREESGKQWLEVSWKRKQGFILVDPDSLSLQNLSEDDALPEGGDPTDEITEDGVEGDEELSLQPKRLKPSDFNPEGKDFSLGLGCTGSTHSEYSVELQFDEGQVRMVDSGLLEYGMPGEACGSTYEEIFLGTYTVEEGQVLARFNRRISRISRATFPNCDATKTEETSTKIERKDRLFMLECDGKKALQLDGQMHSDDAPVTAQSDHYFVIQ